MNTRSGPTSGTVLGNLTPVIMIVASAVAFRYSGVELLQPVSMALGLISVAFAPGYVTISAVVYCSPGSASSERDPASDREPWLSRRGTTELNPLEWGVLSTLTSLVIVPILGLLLSLASVRITQTTMLLSVGGYTLLLGLGTLAHRAVAGETGGLFDGLVPPVKRLTSPPTKVDAFLNVVLVGLVVVGGLGMVAPVPGHESPEFTEFYVLAENGSNEPAMEGYLATTGPNGTQRLWTGITNREHREINYTVVVQAQRVSVTNRSITVTERRRLNKVDLKLDHNESVRIPYEVTAPEPDSGCRIVFLLYAGGEPEVPTVENAYRELHLWQSESPPNPECNSIGQIDVRINGSEPSV